MSGTTPEPSSAAPTRIGIAIVEHGGRYLTGVRPEGVSLAGYAEFPGGKCRPGEHPVEAAVRECLEETGLRIFPACRLYHTEHQYPHGRVDLSFWLCWVGDPEAIQEEHRGFRWKTLEELETLQFPEANSPVVGLLRRGVAGD